MKHPSDVNGRKWTTKDMVREYQRQKYRRERAERIAELAADKANRDGCFGAVLMLMLGAATIAATALQVLA